MAKNTTAINRYNAAVTFNSGKVGNVRFYQKGEKSYVRSAYNSSINNPRTMAQMRRRLKFASNSIIWRQLKGYLEKSFEGSTPSVSTANLFTKANNLGNIGCFLAKDNKNELLTRYQVSQGTLSGITLCYGYYMGDDEASPTLAAFSSLALPSGTYATIGALAAALIAANDNLEEGDQITYLALRQRPVPSLGETRYKISASAVKVVLKSDDTSPVPTGLTSLAGRLAMVLSTTADAKPSNSAFAFIHTRNADGKLRVSTETLRVALDALTTYKAQTTDAAYATAAATYGDGDEIYLSPSGAKSVISTGYVAAYDSTLDEDGDWVVEDMFIVPDDANVISGEGSYEVGSSVTLTKTLPTGWTAQNWVDLDNYENLGTGNTITFTAPVNGRRVGLIVMVRAQ